MVKLFTNAENDVGCSQWRPIPLFLQEPILAVPDGIRTKIFTDIPISNEPNYQAPLSVHTMATNARSLFEINPTNYINAYDKLVKKEMENNKIEIDKSFSIPDETDGRFYQTENADAGASGGGDIFEDLTSYDIRAEELSKEQIEAAVEGTGLIKVKKGRGKDKKPRLRRTKEEIATRTSKEINEDAEESAKQMFEEMKESISKPIQPETMPGLVTQTMTRSESTESSISAISMESSIRGVEEFNVKKGRKDDEY